MSSGERVQSTMDQESEEVARLLDEMNSLKEETERCKIILDSKEKQIEKLKTDVETIKQNVTDLEVPQMILSWINQIEKAAMYGFKEDKSLFDTMSERQREIEFRTQLWKYMLQFKTLNIYIRFIIKELSQEEIPEFSKTVAEMYDIIINEIPDRIADEIPSFDDLINTDKVAVLSNRYLKNEKFFKVMKIIMFRHKDQLKDYIN